VEKPQKAGEIGSALEARVTLSATASEVTVLEPLQVELEEVFILSDLEVISADKASVEISRTPHARCERCWRHRPEVGTSVNHPTLCARCEEALTVVG
jgi:isoleucyl-tRNA synthetase